MNMEQELPDRRPLLYAVVVLLILGAATLLFWPDSQSAGELPSMTFTPGESQAVVSETPAENAAASLIEDARKELSDTEISTPAEEPFPEGEIEIRSLESTDKQPVVKPVEPTRLPAIAIPTGSGSMVLNLGSFASRDNADKFFNSMQAKGIKAFVKTAKKSDGSTIYRVQTGYFSTKTKAVDYKNLLKKEHGLDSWIGQK